MGTTRTERAKDPGGCGGKDRGLWGKGGRLSPHNRASSRRDRRLGRGDRSGSDRDGRSGSRRDKEGAYGQRIGVGPPARSLPRDGSARGVRPLSRALRTILYSPKCVEGEFYELRGHGVLSPPRIIGDSSPLASVGASADVAGGSTPPPPRRRKLER